MKRRNDVMTDYEYLFSTNLHAKLKEKIRGGIFVKVNEKDSLIVKIERKDGNNFSNEIKGSAEMSGLLILYY